MFYDLVIQERRHKKIIRSPYTNDSCGRNAGTVADNGTDLQCQHRSVSWESPILWVPTCACHVPVEDWECPKQVDVMIPSQTWSLQVGECPKRVDGTDGPKHGGLKFRDCPNQGCVMEESIQIKVLCWGCPKHMVDTTKWEGEGGKKTNGLNRMIYKHVRVEILF